MLEASTSDGSIRHGATSASRSSKLGQLSWVLFDAGKAPYYGLIPLFVFAPYLVTTVVGDPVHGQSLLGFLGAAGAILLAIGAPILGAIADQGGRRKPWIAGCVAIGAPSLALLWFATPGTPHLGWILLAMMVGNLAVEFAGVFGNAMLSSIADRGRIGLISGYGMMASNAATLIVLIFFLLAWVWNDTPLFGLDSKAFEPERIAGVLAGLVFLTFSLPLFLFTPDVAPRKVSKLKAIRQGVAGLMETLRSIRNYRNVVRFLIARMVFNEGFIALMMFSGVFAAGILGWDARTLIISGLVNSLLGAIAGFSAALLDRRLGAKRCTMLYVGGCLLANVLMWSIGPDSVLFMKVDVAPTGGLFPTLPDKLFLVASAIVAMCVSAGYASSRTLMSRLSPPERMSEFFGLFALSGNVTSFAAPLLIGLATTVFKTPAAGVPVGAVFLLAGLYLLSRVEED